VVPDSGEAAVQRLFERWLERSAKPRSHRLVAAVEELVEKHRATLDGTRLGCPRRPIVHAVSRRIVGSLDLTIPLRETNRFALSWVVQLADAVQARWRRPPARRKGSRCLPAP